MRLKAFTLIEMLVVLALMGLVLSIVMGLWQQFDLYGKEMHLRKERSTEWQLFDHAMRVDAAAANNVRQNDGRLDLRSPKDSVSYRQLPELCLRTRGGHIDTFEVRIEEFMLDSIGQKKLIQVISQDWPDYPMIYEVFLPSSAKAHQGRSETGGERETGGGR